MAVDPRARAALRVERPSQQHLAFVPGEAFGVEPGADFRHCTDVERRRELGTRGALAELAHVETVAEQKPQRVDEDRLARARLAGQHGEAVAELDVDRLDDDKVADRERRALRAARRTRTRSPSASAKYAWPSQLTAASMPRCKLIVTRDDSAMTIGR